MNKLPPQEKKKKEFLSDFNFNKLLLVEKKKEIIKFIKIFEIFKKTLISNKTKNQSKNEQISPPQKNYPIKEFYETLKKESILKTEMLSLTTLLDIILYSLSLQYFLAPCTKKIEF